MRWLAIAFLMFLVAWRLNAHFAAASVDGEGNRVYAWRTWSKFFIDWL